jgi:magnesium transporter
VVGHLPRIHELKREMLLLRRSVWPLREVIAGLLRAETRLIGPEVEPYLRDVHDQIVQVADAVDTFRDMLSGLQDLYLSSVSNRMNEVMKVLTIFASIFVPLTFVAGIFGMNFQHMPELAWKWSYPIFWCVVLSIGGGMVTYFRRKGWF